MFSISWNLCGVVEMLESEKSGYHVPVMRTVY